MYVSLVLANFSVVANSVVAHSVLLLSFKIPVRAQLERIVTTERTEQEIRRVVSVLRTRFQKMIHFRPRRM
jgi:hypothetical protein